MKIRVIESCGSTNEELKKSIAEMTEGAPLPPAISALEQTGGKGRSGRSFSSPRGKGLYISLPFEMKSVEDALCVMPMASVCVCRAVEKACGLRCGIKWPNDVLAGSRKLCGILTELVPESGHLYLVLGIGIDLTQGEDDFPEDIKDKAVSVKQACGAVISPAEMTELLIPEIEAMIKALPEGKAGYLEYYRERCTTAGRDVSVIFAEGGEVRKGRSLEISEDFGLTVRWEDGSCELLKSGEVSVR